MDPFMRKRNRQGNQKSDRPWVTAEVGLILLDLSFQPVAYNREAVAILTFNATGDESRTIRLPKEILEGIRGHDWSQLPESCACFKAGKREYLCRGYWLHSACDSPERPVLALLFERNSSSVEMIDRISSKFGLTEREREALMGISMGLSSKELAERMNISPNTVKAYLRLIMVKMGVSTRGAIFAKMLEQNRLCGLDLASWQNGPLVSPSAIDN